MNRVGMGYDMHRLIEGRKLMLGGIEVTHDRGLDGHSDADVLLHALSDALLGAIGQGDIGEHFPDTDVRYKDADSTKLLREVMDMVREKSFRVVNVDAVILAEEPKLGKHKARMSEHIARELDLPSERVNIKATTNEGLGFVGRREGMAAYAMVLLEETGTGL